ncbi:MAG: hypothetical protein H0W34_04020 [Pyrinomonadaceae bacterium]|nr:hypothetical protein [Pyrinomonadaceae bacterium]
MSSRYAVVPFMLIMIFAVACATEEEIPTSPMKTVSPSTETAAGGPGMLLPPGSCGSHVYTYQGGAENGGLTFYQSNCGPEYIVYYQVGGLIRSYSGSIYMGQAGGENFCSAFPTVYSCAHPPFEWCEIDPACTGPHPWHEQQ